MLSSDTIAASLINFHHQQTEKIEVFWIESTSSRQQMLEELAKRFTELPILVARVNRDRFNDPNGVSDDLNLTIIENKDWFTAKVREQVINCQKFSLVLISKSPLSIPQSSSPVTLPDWFPQWPCEILTAEVKSVFAAITLSLGSPDIPHLAINSAFFKLEQALCSRLNMIAQLDPSAANAMMATINAAGGGVPPSITDLVARSSQGIRVRSSSEFRPGGSKNSDFIVSQFARVWRDCCPTNRQTLATDVSVALGLNSTSGVYPQYSLMALLTRGKESFSTTPSHITFSRNLLVTISDVVQFVNGIHHTDEFPQFPAMLTITFAKDLAISCDVASLTLSQLI
jgi:hypothetical protein